MVDLEPLDGEDWQTLAEMISSHIAFTRSDYARRILETLEGQPFVKVMPRDYKRVLRAEAKARAEHREPDFAELVGVAAG
jgi:glutamate synthase (NADPH/NADH) large chain